MVSGAGREYIVKPFAMPSASSLGNSGPHTDKKTDPTTPTANGPSVPGPSNPVDQSERPGRRPNVYELPPQYAAGSTGTPAENDASREVDKRI